MSDHDHDNNGSMTRRPQPAQGAGMHDLGRHRRALDDFGRRAAFARPVGSAMAAEPAGMTFLQISDSHVGFDKPANPNALGTLEEAIARSRRCR